MKGGQCTIASHGDARRECPATTRGNYFRDASWSACNKRVPGSGCAARGGVDRRLAVLGHCIANYPGDFVIALTALGATVDVYSQPGQMRRIALEDLHRLPGTRRI
jgi:xanthine dehydrogenase YagS FAD-binding subunit